MAAPVYGKGFKSNLVLSPETDFGSLATGSELAVPFVSENFARKPLYIEDDIKKGRGAAAYPNLAGYTDVSGPLVCKVDYHNMARLFRQAIGIPTLTVYEPTSEITESTSVVIERLVERMQYLGGVIEEMRLIGNVENNSGLVMLETDWIFASGLSSDTALPSVSLTASTYVKMSDLTFRIGDIANALAAGDNIAIRDFTFRLKNNLKIERGSGSAYSIRPIRDGQREVTLDFTVSKYSDNAVVAAIVTAIRAAQSQLQATMTWTSSSNSLTISIPELFGMQRDNLPIADDKILALPVKLIARANLNNVVMMSNVLTADGTFAAATGWTAGSGWTIGSGVVTHATGQTGTLAGTSTATSLIKAYQISFTVAVTTAGTGFSVSLGGNDSGEVFSTAGTKTITIRPTAATGTLLFTPGAGGTFVGTIDNVTINNITEEFTLTTTPA